MVREEDMPKKKETSPYALGAGVLGGSYGASKIGMSDLFYSNRMDDVYFKHYPEMRGILKKYSGSEGPYNYWKFRGDVMRRWQGISVDKAKRSAAKTKFGATKTGQLLAGAKGKLKGTTPVVKDFFRAHPDAAIAAGIGLGAGAVGGAGYKVAQGDKLTKKEKIGAATGAGVGAVGLGAAAKKYGIGRKAYNYYWSGATKEFAEDLGGEVPKISKAKGLGKMAAVGLGVAGIGVGAAFLSNRAKIKEHRQDQTKVNKKIIASTALASGAVVPLMYAASAPWNEVKPDLAHTAKQIVGKTPGTSGKKAARRVLMAAKDFGWGYGQTQGPALKKALIKSYVPMAAVGGAMAGIAVGSAINKGLHANNPSERVKKSWQERRRRYGKTGRS